MTASFGPVRVKICCIGSADEAFTAVRHGAAALGLVSAMPSGPGVIPDELIAEIAAALPPGVSSFLLTSRQDTASIVEQQRRSGVSTVQLCDRLAAGSYGELRAAMPGVKIVQVVHVTGSKSADDAAAVAPHVNALLLDSGNPASRVKELGGTGRTHDWQVSRGIRDRVGVPVFLAGGLKASNVAEAVRQVRPYAVDVCSGVRTDGRLDETKLARFFEAVASA